MFIVINLSAFKFFVLEASLVIFIFTKDYSGYKWLLLSAFFQVKKLGYVLAEICSPVFPECGHMLGKYFLLYLSKFELAIDKLPCSLLSSYNPFIRLHPNYCWCSCQELLVLGTFNYLYLLKFLCKLTTHELNIDFSFY